MSLDFSEAATRIRLRTPVIFLVLAATAIPIEWRVDGWGPLGFSIKIADVAENLAGYVPVGIVLGELGWLRTLMAAAAIATFAEGSQFFMMHRDPSVIDVASNVIGALAGVLLSAGLSINSPEITISRRRALVAAMLASAIAFGMWIGSGVPVNARGETIPGTLEAYWPFDEINGRVVLDLSGHGLQGATRREPTRVAGVKGGSVRLDGVGDSIRFERASPLRLVGSMTVSAWINSASFPVDDAAILSNHTSRAPEAAGYQLDTTVDQGPRTVGFKLIDECGRFVARYGSTPLALDTWYYVAGVYDARARLLDVYLDGKRDNGVLVGSVPGVQRSSRLPTYVGRRADLEGYEFAGSIDEVRVYSRALTPAEIAADMRGDAPGERLNEVGVPAGDRLGQASSHPRCAISSDREDARIPVAAAGVGALLAVASVGLWPSAGGLVAIVFGLAGGLSLLPLLAATLPPMNLWTIPFTSLAGALAIVVSSHPDGGRRR